MNWMQVDAYLKRDDRAVLPLGSTEQHSYLRLTVDAILPERVAVEAAEPLGIPVFPALAYGVTPYFREFPGSISLRVATHLAVVRDILDGMAHSGFRRILICNGHGGNGAVAQLAQEWAADHPGCGVIFHNWWNAPKTWAKVQAIDPVASHGSWMENFPWTRLEGVDQGAERAAIGLHGLLAVGVLPEDRRDPDLDRHRWELLGVYSGVYRTNRADGATLPLSRRSLRPGCAPRRGPPPR